MRRQPMAPADGSVARGRPLTSDEPSGVIDLVARGAIIEPGFRVGARANISLGVARSFSDLLLSFSRFRRSRSLAAVLLLGHFANR